MVRKFPTAGPTPTPRNNPLLSSHTFVIAFIAATIAIVSFLCGKKKRKRSLSSSSNNKTTTTTTTTTDDTTGLLTKTRTNEGVATSFKIRDNTDDPPEKALPPPPRLANIRAASYHIAESSSRSHGAKLTSSMSMRLSGGFKGLKKLGANKDEKVLRSNNQIVENDKLTREDSVWKKTIILGEKCRIPDEDEEDIILDENGQRITTFHRKQSCSSSMSRRSSDVNQDHVIRT